HTRRWRDRYWEELVAQWPFQFHPDGMTVEQASYYHHFTWGFYFQLALLRRQNGLPVPQSLWDGLETALSLMTHLTRPDGRVPMIGDIDNARSIYFYLPEDQWDLRCFQALGAVQFSRSDMKWVAGRPCEELLWLGGEEAVERFQALPARAPEKNSALFPHSGYLVWRSGWDQEADYLMFDFGPIAAGLHPDETPSAAHGHADILQVEVCLQGRPLLIDPGFYTYFGPLAMHRYFRSTAGHNLVEVDGHGQAVHENRLGWSRVVTPQLLAVAEHAPLRLASARITHFSRLEQVYHLRTLLWKEGAYLLVVDYLGTTERPPQLHHLRTRWHFASRPLRLEGESLWAESGPVALMAASAPGRYTLVEGQNNPPAGWMAPGYGHLQPAPMLLLEQQSTLPVLNALLIPLRQEASCKIQLSLQREADSFSLEVVAKASVDRFYFPARQSPGVLTLPEVAVKLSPVLLAGHLNHSGGQRRWFVLSPASEANVTGQFSWLPEPIEKSLTT
ncbi:MAG: hypothetical protein D6715_09125, partial [Calditrichaeota bacterium]